MTVRKPPSHKNPTTPADTYEALLKDITNFGEKTGLKRVRVRVEDIEAEVEFHSDGAGSSQNPASSPSRSLPSASSENQLSPAPDSIESYEKNPKYRVIRSPLVGTFYRSPSPGANPFIEEGSQVDKGNTLAIIEAMKLMNELESEFRGMVEKILVENGTPVEFDQPLIVLSV